MMEGGKAVGRVLRTFFEAPFIREAVPGGIRFFPCGSTPILPKNEKISPLQEDGKRRNPSSSAILSRDPCNSYQF